jgi:hypothetical protein
MHWLEGQTMLVSPLKENALCNAASPPWAAREVNLRTKAGSLSLLFGSSAMIANRSLEEHKLSRTGEIPVQCRNTMLVIPFAGLEIVVRLSFAISNCDNHRTK